ncbi:MAG: hypothetical protein AAFR11_09965 [Pseudomonadota bacterium]
MGVRNEIIRAAGGAIAAPILAIWAIVSILPVFAFFDGGVGFYEAILEIAFLGAGAAGLGGLYGLAWIVASGDEGRRVLIRFTGGRMGLLTGYASLWLVAYGAYQLLR